MTTPTDELVVEPLADRVFVKTLIVTKIGSVHMPEMAQGRPERAEVLAVGPGLRNRDGVQIPVDLQVGDIVYFNRHAGSHISVHDDERLILRESDILARVHDPALLDADDD